MNYISPNNQLDGPLPVRESQVIQGVHVRANPLISQQIHYVTLPVRFTYSTSPSASQTRPLQSRFYQTHNQQFIPPHLQTRNVDKVKRHKIFGEDRPYDDDFTPRRRIYVQSRQYSSPVIDFEKQKESQNHQQQQQSIGNIDDDLKQDQKQQNKLDQQDFFLNNTEDQIKQSLESITHRPILMVDNKSTQSYAQPLRQKNNQQLELDEMMSVQLNPRRQFSEEVQLSPIAPPPFPIPLQQPLMFQEPPFKNLPVSIIKQLSYQQPEPQKQCQKSHQFQPPSIIQYDVVNKSYYWHKVTLALVLLFFVFQIIK